MELNEYLEGMRQRGETMQVERRKVTVKRVVRTLLGLYSPSWVAAASYQLGLAKGLDLPAPALSWLDRWELRNAGVER